MNFRAFFLPLQVSDCICIRRETFRVAMYSRPKAAGLIVSLVNESLVEIINFMSVRINFGYLQGTSPGIGEY